ncbi:DUF4019 domain-containing protein [Variovorax sp. SCN45]|uniref:DUF4019 domain-containing protein n=2 Tax=Comamonadaceae TaxID=80864 RepID=UPI00086B0FCC|nr:MULTISPECIES: DUF4019 domain-containing protein [unclassified Variovorax]MBN8754108.1 DUF4019 domain-containing protein [Variovorax sp.]ODU18417.1 MAG: hypothetical protein ABS94_03245 [Variovorax sp. SCN 67-85]ODV25149.1 MAG: hypothetical protein ABT25_11900 [Variovorax sp. SCN 67-20]OJZ04903.1 MAG: hypothetical protein BGP22_12805 [Variovorax sp. 67-131]
MKPMIRLLLAATLLWSWIGPAAAQEVEAGDMVRGGMQAIQMIDQGKAGELWDGATAATRKRVQRADFINQVASSRAPFGTPRMRTWVAVNRQVVTDPDDDTAGQYVSIEYETRFSNRPDSTLRELVSFHLDRDRIWRFSGYVLR